MQVSVILAHPNRGSFNHAIAEAAVNALKRNGHQVHYHDLYKERVRADSAYGRDSQSAHLPADVELHCREISTADGIIVVHPNWWGQPPAVLKGWVDRVIRPGVAYEFDEGDQGEGVPIGLLAAKVACVFNTSNTTPQREATVFGDPLEALWKRCIFDLCGVRSFHRETFSVIVTSTPEQRSEWLARVQEVMRHYFPAATCH